MLSRRLKALLIKFMFLASLNDIFAVLELRGAPPVKMWAKNNLDGQGLKLNDKKKDRTFSQ